MHYSSECPEQLMIHFHIYILFGDKDDKVRWQKMIFKNFKRVFSSRLAAVQKFPTHRLSSIFLYPHRKSTDIYRVTSLYTDIGGLNAIFNFFKLSS
jgi:hypothetical protein